MRFGIAIACLAATSCGNHPSYSDTCLTWGVECDSYNKQGDCCEHMVCQYDSGVTEQQFRCLEEVIPWPHYHIECGAWGNFCDPGDGFCCEDLACYTHPDPEIAAKGYHMCTPLASSPEL